MRVDLLGVCASTLGTCLALAAIRRPALVYLASIAFVIAIFTKQTLVAAPLAAFAVLLLRDPRYALRGIVLAIALGLATLAVLEWQTAGGFLRHIVFYNINRFSVRHIFGSTLKVWVYAG